MHLPNSGTNPCWFIPPPVWDSTGHRRQWYYVQDTQCRKVNLTHCPRIFVLILLSGRWFNDISSRESWSTLSEEMQQWKGSVDYYKGRWMQLYVHATLARRNSKLLSFSWLIFNICNPNSWMKDMSRSSRSLTWIMICYQSAVILSEWYRLVGQTTTAIRASELTYCTPKLPRWTVSGFGARIDRSRKV